MLKIELYTEITCPWCIIGQHRLDKVLAERFSGLVADIRHHPVLLLPDAPAAGVYIPDLLRSRYGAADPKAAFARPEGEARASGGWTLISAAKLGPIPPRLPMPSFSPLANAAHSIASGWQFPKPTSWKRRI